MNQNKRKIKIKIKSPLRMIGTVLILLLLIFGITKGIQAIGGYDPIEKEISKSEGQDIVVLSKEITATVESGDVDAEAEILYGVLYTYKVNNTTKEYPIEDGMDIEVSDTALATVVNENSVVISNAPSDTDSNEVTVKVSYGKLSAEYIYNVILP